MAIPRVRPFAATLIVVFLSAGLAAQEADEDEKNEDEKLSQERLELMQKFVGEFECRAEEEDFPEEFELEPIFRYTDPTFSYVAAALWRLGPEGRPRAIVSTELHRDFFGSPRIVFEYLALSEAPFSVTSRAARWTPAEGALDFAPVPDVSAPAETPERRLRQMRNIARRFTASQGNGGSLTELRLLPTPILRYEESDAERADGAIFLYALGTNPELALFVESDGEKWTFSAGRLSAAKQIVLTIEDETLWQAPEKSYGWDQSYTASNLTTEIPGVEP